MINFDAVLTPKKFHKTIMAHNSKCSSNLFQGGGGMRMTMYYLIYEKECFIIFKTRGAAERFRYDKTRLFECIK